tara:strand:+ start:1100 stop:1315 length:216 start_codon:yes stop_codon:yes gene_type:complete
MIVNIYIDNATSDEVMDYVTNGLGWMGLDNPIVERYDVDGSAELVCEFRGKEYLDEFIWQLESAGYDVDYN